MRRNASAGQRGPAIFLIAIASIACLPAFASAQTAQAQTAPGSDRVAIARALFEEGLEHVDAQRWALAADCFSRMLQLRYSAVAAYNLALSQARLGNSARAVERARELLAQPTLEPTVRKAASDLLEEQEDEVAWLQVRVAGDCEDCVVELEDQRLDRTALARPIPVDPGRHVLRLTRDSSQLSSSQVDVTRGQRLSVELAIGQPMAAAPIPSARFAATRAPSWKRSSAGAGSLGQPPQSRVDESDDDSSLFASPWFWGAVGVVAAGSIALAVGLGSSDAKSTPPVPGDFSPGVVKGVVGP